MKLETTINTTVDSLSGELAAVLCFADITIYRHVRSSIFYPLAFISEVTPLAVVSNRKQDSQHIKLYAHGPSPPTYSIGGLSPFAV